MADDICGRGEKNVYLAMCKDQAREESTVFPLPDERQAKRRTALRRKAFQGAAERSPAGLRAFLRESLSVSRLLYHQLQRDDMARLFGWRRMARS